MANGNPWYVDPSNNMLPGLNALSQGVQAYGQKREENKLKEKFEKIKSGAVAAYQSGDPNTMAEFALRNPEISQALTGMMNFKSKMTKDNYIQSGYDLIANPSPDNAQRVTEARQKFLRSQGLKPEETVETDNFLQRFNQDPEKAKKELSLTLAALDPEKWKSFNQSMTGKTGKESPMQKTGAFLVKDPDSGATSVAIGVFDPNSGTLKTETSEFEGVDIVSALGETPDERQQREVKTAGLKRLSEEEQKRASDLISRGIAAAESTATIRRGIELLGEVETGGIDAVANKVKRLFGIESADEGELSNMLGKAVLSQLRETFGAAFTQEEGNRLQRIEAGFGKSPATNKRLLSQALRIAERTAKRARTKAKELGDNFTVEDIDDLLNFSLSNPEDFTLKNPSEMSDEELRKIATGGK